MPIIRNAQFTIFPSECYESFGLGIVESMSQGTPPISAHIGGAKELICKGIDGFYFESRNDSSLKSIIQKTSKLKEYEYQKMAKEGLLAAKRFSKNQYYEGLMKIYKSVLL